MKCPICDVKNKHILDCFGDMEEPLRSVLIKFEGYEDNILLNAFKYEGKQYYYCGSCRTMFDKTLSKTKLNLSYG